MSLSKYEPGWKLLGDTVRRRRDRLGITQEQVAEAGGPSAATLRLIENAQAKDPRSKTLFSLDHALGWRRGSAIGLVEGKAPAGGWEFNFDEFVEDLIDYVTDQSREQFDVPVSPRQRRFELPLGTTARSIDTPDLSSAQSPTERSGEGFADLGDELADDRFPEGDVEAGSAVSHLGPLTAAVPHRGRWQPVDPHQTYKEVLERLPMLTLSDLRQVSILVDQIYRSREGEALGAFGLISPDVLDRLRISVYPVMSAEDRKEIRERLIRYSHAQAQALKANEILTDRQRDYVRASSPTNRERVEAQIEALNKAAAIAQAELNGFEEMYDEANARQGKKTGRGS
jgi:transcriptional regulator with XRE-family HTH domain